LKGLIPLTPFPNFLRLVLFLPAESKKKKVTGVEGNCVPPAAGGKFIKNQFS
jgi:hypothetical protein